jgi:hypothetical protein
LSELDEEKVVEGTFKIKATNKIISIKVPHIEQEDSSVILIQDITKLKKY